MKAREQAPLTPGEILAVVNRADAMIERYQLRIAAQVDTITRLLAASGAPDSAANEIALLHEQLAESRANAKLPQD